MKTTRFKKLENEVKNSVSTLCENHPTLVEDLYDDRVKKNTELDDIAMRRSLSKSLVK
jgi:hypothetical protein